MAALATSPSPRSSAPPVILTGARLRALLLPASAMPAGLTLELAGARDSGGTVVNDTSTPPPPGKVCTLLTGTSWVLAAGIASAAFAENDYADASRTAEAGQEIDAFQGTDAAQVMSRLWLAFGHCARFSSGSGRRKATITARRSRLPGVGDEAIRLFTTSPRYRGGETLVAVRVANNVITCFDSSPRQDLGAPAIALARELAGGVRAASKAARRTAGGGRAG